MSDLLPDNPPTAENGYTVDSTMEMTAALFNSILSSIHGRLVAREELEASFAALIAEGTSAGLTMIQENIAPQLAALQNTIAASQDAIAEMMAGTAPNAANAEKLGGQFPAYYLAPENFSVSATVKSLLAAADVAGARDVLEVGSAISAAVNAAVDELLDGSPDALDTLKELAAALGNDADFATTVTNALTGKLPLAGGTMDAGAIVAFPAEIGEKIRLYGSGYGIGVEASTLNYWGGGTHRFRGSGGSAGAILAEIVETPTQAQHLTRKDYVDALASIGVGQTWQDMTASRTHSTTYQNTTGRPIQVAVGTAYAGSVNFQVSPNGSSWMNVDGGGGQESLHAQVIIPTGWRYRISASVTIYFWMELR